MAVDAGVVGFIEALDPTALSDEDFDGLLAASGLVGESADGELELPTPDGARSTRCSTSRRRPCARRCWWRSSTGSSDPSAGPAMTTPMSALAGLVEKGLVAPDWAEALAPVDDRIAAMGGFLREEVAAGRGYQPAGDLVLRAFQRPLADVRVLVVGQDPYPNPDHPIGLSFAVERHVWPLPPSLPTSTSSCATTSASCRRVTGTCRRGPTRA